MVDQWGQTLLMRVYASDFLSPPLAFGHTCLSTSFSILLRNLSFPKTQALLVAVLISAKVFSVI